MGLQLGIGLRGLKSRVKKVLGCGALGQENRFLDLGRRVWGVRLRG